MTVQFASVLGDKVMFTTVNAKAWPAVAPTLSVAVTVKVKVPVAVGVPLSTPPVDNVMPFGIAPTVTAKVTVDVPPVDAIVCEYPARFNVAFGNVVVVITSAGLIVNVNVCVRVAPTESFNVTLTLLAVLAVAVGVPLMVIVLPAMAALKPLGKPVTLKPL